jgi:hypothetical protein
VRVTNTFARNVGPVVQVELNNHEALMLIAYLAMRMEGRATGPLTLMTEDGEALWFQLVRERQ